MVGRSLISISVSESLDTLQGVCGAVEKYVVSLIMKRKEARKLIPKSGETKLSRVRTTYSRYILVSLILL